MSIIDYYGLMETWAYIFIKKRSNHEKEVWNPQLPA